MSAGRVRVLVVDDAPHVRETIRTMLELAGEFDVVGEAADGSEAVDKARQLHPDVILMDINLPRLDGISATGRIMRETATHVIVISVENGQEYFRRAMRAGARDFLVKPFSADGLADAIRKAVGARPNAVRETKLITVFGAKGGVGRSTIAANLAAALGREAPDRRVALVDLDLEFGVQASLFDLQPTVAIHDLCQSGPLPAERVEAACSKVPGLPIWLLAAPPQPHLAAMVDGSARADPQRDYTGEILEGLLERFDDVVVDTASGFREANLAALDRSQLILLVTTPDLPALQNTAKSLQVLLRDLNYDRDRIRVLVNRADEAVGLSVSDIAAGLEVTAAIELPSDRQMVVAANIGQPLTARRGRSRALEAIVGLAKNLRVAGGGDR